MSWKDLDIKLKAELIKLGVLSGIRDIKYIRLLYDDNNTPTLVVELSYNETNVRPLLGIERIKLEYSIPEEEINKANDIIQLIEKEISLEEINNQLPVLFRQFNKEGYISNNPTLALIGKVNKFNDGGHRDTQPEKSNISITERQHPLSYITRSGAYIREGVLYLADLLGIPSHFTNAARDLNSRVSNAIPLFLNTAYNKVKDSDMTWLEAYKQADTNPALLNKVFSVTPFINTEDNYSLAELADQYFRRKLSPGKPGAITSVAYKSQNPDGKYAKNITNILSPASVSEWSLGLTSGVKRGDKNYTFDIFAFDTKDTYGTYDRAVKSGNATPGEYLRYIMGILGSKGYNDNTNSYNGIRTYINTEAQKDAYNKQKTKKNGGFLFPTKTLTNKVNKFREGGHEDGDENTIYTAGYSEPITVTAKKEISKKQQMKADEEWREYLKQHPIQIGSEEYNKLPERAKALVYKNSVTDAMNKAALPTAAAIIAPTLLTAGATSLVGSDALTAAADVAGNIGTKIAGTNLGQAASDFMNNPYINLGLTGLGAYFIPQHFNNGITNIKTGNYVGALGDFGMIGLETLGATNTAKLLANSAKGIIKPLFANPYSPNTLTRVIGTGTSGVDDAISSGIIRGNPNKGIQTARKLHRQLATMQKRGVPKKTINNYLSNNLSEKDYEILKKYMPEWFSDTKTVFQVNGLSFSLGRRGLPTKYEDYIKEFRSANPLFKNKTNFNPLTEQEVLLNWEGVPEPTFALSPDLSKKYGFKTENVLNSNLFKGDYAILIKNAETHGTPLTLAGHLPEHWSLKYPMEYNHPDVTFYKRLGIPFINKNIYYKINPLKYTTVSLNKNGGSLFPNLAFSHKFEK